MLPKSPPNPLSPATVPASLPGASERVDLFSNLLSSPRALYTGNHAMDLANVLGIAAGCLTTTSFLPQVIKIWKTKSAHDISSGMFVIFSAGVLLWLVYGLATHAPPIILANAI